ncbi:hypothetical protein [Methanococcoides seepicolus]|uniref:Uncharacterized protein n=1 Tax=Methanococcoides seepicolus TaxID=2828780 RepID=A0A9E4ZDP5_9EURY|nr:hypothetical protein [Methanococcoides seepicolus]MCM1986346.1 hypothetical protein [Methanococcoides seepicolus]
MVKIGYILVLVFFVIGVVSFIQYIQYESGKNGIEEGPKTLSVNANGSLEMINGSYSDITKMSIRNGFNGDLIEISNKDEISALTKHISRFSYTENSSLEGIRSCGYSIKFYDESHLISTFIIRNIRNSYHVTVDGVHYTPNEPGFESCVSRYWDDLYGSESDKWGLD